MNAFKNRFFIPISLIFLGFLAFGLNKIAVEIFLIFAIFLLVFRLCASKIGFKSRKLNTVLMLFLAASLLGTLISGVFVFKNEKLVEKYTGEHVISGYVAELSASYPHMSECVVQIESVDGEDALFRAVLVTEFPSDLSLGDFFECEVKLSPLAENTELDYLKNQNPHDYPLLCVVSDESEMNMRQSEFRISLMLASLNAQLSSKLKAVLSPREGALASALLLGNRHLLEDSVLRDFKRAGVYHMLALSGLHVAILIGMLERILKRLLVVRKKRIVILIAISLFYIALTGFQLSACRSMLMLWVLYLSYVLRLRRDSLTSLFVAVCVIGVISPSAICDLGLQLSFLSTFGMIAASMIRKKLAFFRRHIFGRGISVKIKEWARELVFLCLCSLCVFVVTLPLLEKYFGEVSLATFFSNLFMGAVCEVFMIISILALLTSGFLILGAIAGGVASIIGATMLGLVEKISNVKGVMLSLEYPFIEYLIWGVFLFSLILFGIRLRRKWLIALPSAVFGVLLCACVIIYGAWRSDFVRAEFVLGDALVLSSASEVYICDASEGRYGSFYDAVNIAKQNCLTEIDGVVLTHYHSYHSISLSRLANEFKLYRVYLPKPQNIKETRNFEKIYSSLSKKGVEVYVFDASMPLELLGGEICITPRSYSSYSHPSVAVSYAHGDRRISLLERPYFDTYLEKDANFKKLLDDSDVVIFGSDGRAPEKEFDLFYRLKKGAEVVFCHSEDLLLSDAEAYLSDFSVYTDASYKKYDLK